MSTPTDGIKDGFSERWQSIIQSLTEASNASNNALLELGATLVELAKAADHDHADCDCDDCRKGRRG